MARSRKNRANGYVGSAMIAPAQPAVNPLRHAWPSQRGLLARRGWADGSAGALRADGRESHCARGIPAPDGGPALVRPAAAGGAEAPYGCDARDGRQVQAAVIGQAVQRVVGRDDGDQRARGGQGEAG
jgi:hypothetical protein